MFVALASPLSAMAATNPYATKLVFVKNGDLYTCNSNGTSVKRITKGTSFDTSPRWSADHRRVYFVRQSTAGIDSVCSVNASGGVVSTVLTGSLATTGTEGRAFTSIAPGRDGKTLLVADVRSSLTTSAPRVMRYRFADLTSTVLVSEPASKIDVSYQWIDEGTKASRILAAIRVGDSQALSSYDTASRLRTEIISEGGNAWSARFGPKDAILCSMWDFSKCFFMSTNFYGDISKVYGSFTSETSQPYVAVGYSPDGTKIAFQRGGSLYVVSKSLSAKSAKKIATGLSVEPQSADW
jgi:hypothetical protein